MSPVVLDCSAALCWCFADEATPASDRLLARVEVFGATVPTLFRMEVANVLLLAERRKRIDQGAAGGLAERLTVYDAAYLDLALRRGLPLVSKDRDLLAASKRRGVALIPLLDG